MRASLRLLAVVLGLWGSGALHALVEAAEAAEAGGCGDCERESGGETPCGAFCACCPVPAAAPLAASGVGVPAAPVSALDARAPAATGAHAAAEIFHPPRA